jgi:hypothetical protein
LLRRRARTRSAACSTAYVSIRQHTSAYVLSCFDAARELDPPPVVQHTSAYVSIRQHTSCLASTPRANSIRRLHVRACMRPYAISVCGQPSASVSIRQHPSASVSIRQHTSAYVSIRQHSDSTPTSACVWAPAAYVSIRQHPSAYVSIAIRRLQVRACSSIFCVSMCTLY